MPQQPIDIGEAPGDGTGDPARVAFDKANANFTELYAAQAQANATAAANAAEARAIFNRVYLGAY